MSGSPVTSSTPYTAAPDAAAKESWWRRHMKCDDDDDKTDKEREEECERKCKKCCKPICCVLPLVILGALIWGVFAVARARYQSSFPDACFVDYRAPNHRRHDDAELSSALRVEELDAAALASLCSAQLSTLCGSAPADFETAFEWQACAADNFYRLDAQCRSAVTAARIFDEALYPAALRDEDRLEEAIDACKDDASDFCERAAQHFDDDNLCQVYEVALCLQARPAGEVSSQCLAKIAEFGIEAPPDYNADKFSLQIPEERRHGLGFWGGFLIFLASVLGLKICFGCGKKVQERRRDRVGARAQADKLAGVESAMPAKMMV